MVREYSNATIEKMGGGIKWNEAGSRVAALTDLPADAVEQVAIPKPVDKPGVDVYDPFGGTRPDDQLGVSGASSLPRGVTPPRVDRRRALMEQFDASRRWLEDYERVKSFDRFQDLPWSLTRIMHLKVGCVQQAVT